MGFLNFFGKKEKSKISSDDKIVPPPYSKNPERAYSELPTFPTPTKGKEISLLPPLEPFNPNSIKGAVEKKEFTPAPEKELFPIPPQPQPIKPVEPAAPQKVERVEKIPAQATKVVSMKKEEAPVGQRLLVKYQVGKPLFVDKNDFGAMVSDIDKTMASLRKAATAFNHLDEIEHAKNNEFSKWSKSLEFIQRRLDTVDKKIFDGR